MDEACQADFSAICGKCALSTTAEATIGTAKAMSLTPLLKCAKNQTKQATKVSNGSAAAAASADDAGDENGNGVFPSVSDPENSSQFSSGSVSVLVEDSENEMDEDVGGPAVDFSSSVPVTSSVGYSPCTSSS